MIPLPQIPTIVNKKGDNIAVFEISPLYPGYGVTIGNTYRRVLLSSLEGAAITEVKIKNASHEFANLPGVMEDVVMILLNLKKIRFKLWTDEPQTITLSVKGEKEVTAKDFKPNPNVKIINPSSYIATLTSKSAALEITAKVEKGLGYSRAEEREEKKTEVGVLPIDAIFTPVKRVSFRIENVRVGKRTDFDKLHIEIETDGTITPEEAFKGATAILLEHFSLFESFNKNKETEKKSTEKETAESKKEEKASQDDKKVKIEDLSISDRLKNILISNGVKTVGGLIRKSAQDLKAMEGLGDKGISEIEKALKKMNLQLK